MDNSFITGINYLASNAGIKMWTNFDPVIIDNDLRKIKSLKIDVIRIFPLWSDFQPVSMIYECNGKEQMLGFKGDNLLPDTYVGRAGLDNNMLERFETVLDLAYKHGLKVYIGILSGWLSGRLFVPPVLEGRSLTSDPLALKMEMDFIRVFVERFRNKPAVAGWASGNETDCLSDASWDERLAWQTMMRNAIKAADPHHPVLSDMHPLRSYGTHNVAKRRDIFDVATIHTYAYFTPYCLNEPIDSMRGLLQSTCEAAVYSGVLGIPCLMEETGTVGEFVCSRNITANYAKTNLYSAWANGASGLVWWCGFDQWHLEYPPYSKDALERELGVFYKDGNEKPVAVTFRDFKETIEAFDFKITPPKTDAVCIMGKQNDFSIPLGAYVLSKQAGFNITYAYETSVPKSNCYIIPCMYNSVDGRIFKRLMEDVKNGATLYMSYDNWINISRSEETIGSILERNYLRGKPLETEDGEKYNVQVKLQLTPTKSKVLLKEKDDNPILTEYKYGKGKIIFCAIPCEKLFSESFGGEHNLLLNIYKSIARNIPLSVTKNAKEIGITEHVLTDGRKIIVAINYSNTTVYDTLTFNNVSFKKCYLGDIKDNHISLKPHDVAIFEIA